MESLLEVQNLKTFFHTRSGVIKAVDGVSFQLQRGECLAIVGESGSGKSVSMLSLLQLLPTPPARTQADKIDFCGTSLLTSTPNQMRSLRGNRISMVFQDPMSSLNPYLKISTQLMETIQTHDPSCKDKDALRRCIDTLVQVGITNPEEKIHFYPHQFSGGMRQRVMIAMALLNSPDLLIADEPTTALDVTIQAQILELLKTLQKERQLSIILITHDMGIVAGMAQRVMVMYAGRPVEYGNVSEIFASPQHPYTKGLLKSIPRLDQPDAELFSIPGLPPDPARLPPGCSFAPRCSLKQAICSTDPSWKSLLSGQKSRCHFSA